MSEPATYTKHRALRIPDDLWEQAKAKAEAEHTTTTAVIIRLLHGYVDDTLVSVPRGVTLLMPA